MAAPVGSTPEPEFDGRQLVASSATPSTSANTAIRHGYDMSASLRLCPAPPAGRALVRRERGTPGSRRPLTHCCFFTSLSNQCGSEVARGVVQRQGRVVEV